MEVTRLVDVGDGRLRPMPMERYTFGWSDWRTLYPVAPPSAAPPVRSTDSRDIIDRCVDAIVAAGEWLTDQLLRVVP